MQKFQKITEKTKGKTLDDLIETLRELAVFVPGKAVVSVTSNYAGALIVETEWELSHRDTNSRPIDPEA